MAVTFDHSTQRINVTNPDTSLAMQDLINDIRIEEASERGITYPVIASAAGKDYLGGGVYTGITVNLKDPWQLAFWVGNYIFSVGDGNLVSSRSDNQPFALVIGGPQINNTLSAASTIAVVSTGSGLDSGQDAKLTAIFADTQKNEILTPAGKNYWRVKL